jgi:hypothetical protein
MAMKCAECLGQDEPIETDAVTVMSGFAVCEDHRAAILDAFTHAQEQARLNALRP